MKKTLLLSVILLSNVSLLFAQKSVLVSDSAFLDYNQRISLQPDFWENRVYNSNCLDSIYQGFYTHLAFNNAQSIYTYNPNASLFQQITQSYDTISQTFVNKSRTTHAYNALNLPTTQTTENWNGIEWKPGGLGNYYYNSKGQDTLYLYQTWDSVQQVYVNNEETVNTYDASGRNTSYVYEDWNSNDNTWDPYFGYYSTYDANGLLTSYSVSATNYFTNVFEMVSKYVSYYNSQGLADSSYQIDNDYYLKDSIRNHYIYYPLSTAVQQVISYKYDGNRVYTGGVVNNHYYNTIGITHIDSTISQNFTTTPENTSPGGSVNVKFHDSANYIVTDSMIIKNFTDTPNLASINYTDVILTEYNAFGQPVMDIYRDSNYYGFPYLNYREDHFHYMLCSSALPITLLNFTASQKNKDALLQWQTRNETNASFFTIQRSEDGIHFTNIGKVMAAGNSSVEKDYNYTDANIISLGASKLFYRLAEQDNNGTIIYSKTAKLFINGGKLSVSISPNPVQNTIIVFSPVSISNAVLRVTDMNGIVLYTSHQNIIAGEKVPIDASAFSKGVYMVTVQSQTDKQVYKIVK